VASTEEMPAVLQERLADVALGPRLAGEGALGLESIPLLRYRLMIVAAPSHRLAESSQVPVRALVGETWLVDPEATDVASPVARMLHQLDVAERDVRVFASQAAAWDAAEQGQGVAPAVAHLVASEIDRGSLVGLDIEGMPVQLMWHATMLSPDRRSAAAANLRQFMATPDATHAMHAPSRGVPPSRFRPPVYVTLWS